MLIDGGNDGLPHETKVSLDFDGRRGSRHRQLTPLNLMERKLLQMTHYPDHLKTYPNMHAALPLHLKLHRLKNGFPTHRHDFLEFSYVVSGSGSETIDGIVHPMTPGTFTFILPFQVHEIFTEPGSTLELYNCNFSMELLFEIGMQGRFGEWLGARAPADGELMSHAVFAGEEAADMLRRIESMLSEYRASEQWRDPLLKAMLTETLIRFDRHRRRTTPLAGPRYADVEGSDGFRAAASHSSHGTGSRKGKASVWTVIHYIHANFHEELTLTDLARKFSFSVSRMSEVIKEATGQSFVNLLHDVRVRQACGLLVSTDMSVTEIAHEVGFGSYKTFARMFKESRGVAPSDYRKHKRTMAARGGL